MRFTFVGDVHFNAIALRQYGIVDLRIGNEHLAVINNQHPVLFERPAIFQDFECIAVADFMVQRLYNFSGIDRRNTFDPVTGSPISC
ncbi:Uncharacterised protein [Enterobacter cloacae]|nr:Uncharacterised protein [Enterobacter cloacae]